MSLDLDAMKKHYEEVRALPNINNTLPVGVLALLAEIPALAAELRAARAEQPQYERVGTFFRYLTPTGPGPWTFTADGEDGIALAALYPGDLRDAFAGPKPTAV